MTETFGKVHYIRVKDLLSETSNILQEVKCTKGDFIYMDKVVIHEEMNSYNKTVSNRELKYLR